MNKRFLLLLGLVFIGLVGAGTITITEETPTNYSSGISDFLNCTTSTDATNIKNVSLYTDSTSAWALNETRYYTRVQMPGTTVPTAFYQMEAGGGNVLDEIGLYNSTPIGMTRRTDGKIGKGFNFTNPTNEFFYNQTAFNYSDPSTQPVTVIAWFNPEHVDGEQVIVWKGKSTGTAVFELMLKDDKLRARSNRNAGVVEVLCTTTITTGSWYMGIMISNSTGIYCGTNNGIENGTLNVNPIDPYVEANFSVGVGSYGATIFGNFSGAIDEVSVWNRSVSTGNLANLYNSGKASRPTWTNSEDNTFDFKYSSTTQWSCYACDDENNCSFGANQTSPKVLELSNDFLSSTTSGNMEDFILNIQTNPSFTLSSAFLWYNDTNYIASFNNTANSFTVSANLIIPSVGSPTDLTALWELNFNDSSQENSSEFNQTVNPIGIDNCSVYSEVLFNFTMVDEENQNELNETALNTSMEIAVTLYSSDRTSEVVNFSGNFSDNPQAICLDINRSEDFNFSVDSTIKYEAEGYAIEYYNIQNFLLTNDTMNQNITLYDLNETDSTEFQLTFTGTDYVPVEGALVFIERQYISENVFKTVELPKTDSNGQTILHLVRNDVIYNIIVVKDDGVLGTFTNLRAFCEDFSIGDCKITLNALTDVSALFNYDEGVGITYSLPPIYNETTNIVSFSFISTDGTSKTLLMEVERRDVFGNTSICENTVVSTSGTVFCNVGNISDTSVITTISVDGTEWLISSVTLDNSAYGSAGFAMWFILSIALVLMFGESRNGILISLLIGFIGAVALGWTAGGVLGIGGAGIWIIALTVAGLWKVNSGRQN